MTRFFRRWWQDWLCHRIPRSDKRLLTQKNIFILPTGAGVVFAVLLLVMLLTAINYQNSLIYLTTFLLGTVFVGAIYQTHQNLAGLMLTMVQAGEGFVGENAVFRLRASAGKREAVAIRLSCPQAVDVVFHVPAGQSRDVILAVPAQARGYLRPDRIRVETRFPFGLLRAWSWMRPLSAAICYPKPLPAPERTGAGAEGGGSEQIRSPQGMDHMELRSWREGDPMSRVLWKRVARDGQMLVADWQGVAGSPDLLDFHAFPGIDHELRLSYLAALVLERSQQERMFGLLLPGQRIEPDSGQVHARRCLRALAVWGHDEP